MTRKRLGLWGGLGLACLACCAAPFLVPVVAVLGSAGLAGFLTRNLDVMACAAVALGVTVIVLLMRKRPAKAVSCQADGFCGCEPKP